MKITYKQEQHLEPALKIVRKIGGRDGDERQVNLNGHWYGFVMKDKKWQLFDVSTWTQKELLFQS